jgi:DNA repair ATPase RecN
MPVVTVEQIVRFREASLMVEQQRDAAWHQLREIREAIAANPEESTLDEARRVVAQRDKLLAPLKGLCGLAALRPGHLHEYVAAVKEARQAIAEIEAAQ